MKNRVKLSAGDLDFFRMVARAAFSNPFSFERHEYDRRIVGASEKSTRNAVLNQLLRQLQERVSTLGAANLHGTGRRVNIALYSNPDREVLLTSVLFMLFHQYTKQFDVLIHEQLEAGGEPRRAVFTGEVFGKMLSYGLDRAEACRYVSMFFQIRRAYHFISKGLTGRSHCMRQLRKRLWDNIFTHDIRWYLSCLWNRTEDFSTLLLGKTGTGKGAAAAAIGRSGFIPFDPGTECFKESFISAFVSINLSQYPETLIESELFGHRKGAFTGAIDDHEGVFAQCSPHGAIFLDEIGDVSIPVQIKLLQVLQERTFAPVGGHAPRRFEGRVIAATNKSLSALRRAGEFRDDFFYRLCSDQITLPTLQQRIQEDPRELEMLVDHILERHFGEYGTEMKGKVMSLLGDARMRGYAWPGNVRELEQAVRRILLSGTYEIDMSTTASGGEDDFVAAIEAGMLTADQLISRYCLRIYKRHGTYEEVARRTDLNWRTVKKHIENA